MKKQRQKHGLTAKQFKISDDALYGLIDFYTREAGVRKLERRIAELCRKAAKEIVENSKPSVSVSASNLETLLGPKNIVGKKLTEKIRWAL